MYYVNIEKIFNDRTEATEEQFKGSIQAGDRIEALIGEMVSTWRGKWELESRQVGHPEANYYEYHGERVESADGSDTKVSFLISTWG